MTPTRSTGECRFGGSLRLRITPQARRNCSRRFDETPKLKKGDKELGVSPRPPEFQLPQSTRCEHGRSEPRPTNDGAYHFSFKVAICGDTGVGKTTLLEGENAQSNNRPGDTTVGINFRVKFYEVDG